MAHNPAIRLIGLDLDGTTFNTKKQITPRTKEAIARAIEKGVIVLPATGRQLIGLPEAFMQIPGVRYALCSNGAKVYDIKTGAVLHSDCMTVQHALDVLQDCRRFPCLISVFIEGASFADADTMARAADFVPPNMLEYYLTTRERVDDLALAIQEYAKPVEKYALNFNDESCRAKARAAFEARGDVAVTSSVPGNLELNTPTAHKGAGMLALGRLLGIPREGIMAVGDSSNDLEMIQAAGFGVAMGNASDDVKAVADAVTASCDDDGVAKIIEEVAGL